MQRVAEIAVIEKPRPILGMIKNAKRNVLVTPESVEVKKALPTISPVCFLFDDN